jgi:hypothetical protein
MPFRSDPSEHLKATPLDYVKYAFGVLAALLLVPALLQGALAFLQTFLQTLLSIVLTLNLLMLSAVAGVVGVWVWQRRGLASSVESVTIEPTISVEPTILNDPAPDLGTLEPQTRDEDLANEDLANEDIADDRTEVSSIGDAMLRRVDSADSALPGFAALAIPSPDAIPVTIPDVVSETPRSPIAQDIAPSDDQTRPEPLEPFIQAQLARRLGVSSSTIGVRKLKPDFGEWSSQKDPAGLAWRYCEEARQFFVVPASA